MSVCAAKESVYPESGKEFIHAIGGWRFVYERNSGTLDASARATNYQYDPQNDVWATKAALAAARMTVGGSIDGNIYTAGGSATPGHTPATDDTLAYNTVANSWSSKVDLPKNIHSLAAAVVDGGLYLFGGEAVDADTECRVYDPTANTWTDKTAAPAGINVGGAFVIEHMAFVPRSTSSARYGNTLLRYSKALDAWSTQEEIPDYGATAAGAQSSAYPAVSQMNGRGFLCGGASDSYSEMTDASHRTNIPASHGVAQSFHRYTGWASELGVIARWRAGAGTTKPADTVRMAIFGGGGVPKRDVSATSNAFLKFEDYCSRETQVKVGDSGNWETKSVMPGTYGVSHVFGVAV